jgi:hypothetical protein
MTKLRHRIFHRETLPIFSGCRYCDAERWRGLFGAVKRGETTWSAIGEALRDIEGSRRRPS